MDVFKKPQLWLLLTYNVLMGCMSKGDIIPPGRWTAIATVLVFVLTNMLALFFNSVVPKGDTGPAKLSALLPFLMAVSALGWLAGCAGFKVPAYTTLTAVVNASAEAQGKIPHACEVAQNAAVDAARDKPTALANVKTIQDRCDAAITGCDAVTKIARTGRDGLADGANIAGDPKAIAGWAIGAIDAYRNISALLKTLGVEAPHVPGVN